MCNFFVSRTVPCRLLRNAASIGSSGNSLAALIQQDFPRTAPFVLLPGERGKLRNYSIFCRIDEHVSLVRSPTSRDNAIERIQRLSAREPGEFVLFRQLNVVAVANEVF